LNARYYEGSRGQFLSQDSVFRNIGVDSRTLQVLTDPQSMNSYSYARGNPIIYKDASGEIPLLLATAGVGAFIGGIAGIAGQAIGDHYSGENFNWSNYSGAFVGGATQGDVADRR
jgi:RHS repeat-associated protein